MPFPILPGHFIMSHAFRLLLLALGLVAHVALLSIAPVLAKPPNIVFIFSDDHAYQAISAYGDPRQADRDAQHRPAGPRGDAFRPLPGSQLDLRAEPGHGADRQIFASQRLLQQHQLPLRRHAKPRFPSCSRPPDIKPRSSANGTWSAIRPVSITGKSCQGRGIIIGRR